MIASAWAADKTSDGFISGNMWKFSASLRQVSWGKEKHQKWGLNLPKRECAIRSSSFDQQESTLNSTSCLFQWGEIWNQTVGFWGAKIEGGPAFPLRQNRICGGETPIGSHVHCKSCISWPSRYSNSWLFWRYSGDTLDTSTWGLRKMVVPQ